MSLTMESLRKDNLNRLQGTDKDASLDSLTHRKMFKSRTKTLHKSKIHTHTRRHKLHSTYLKFYVCLCICPWLHLIFGFVVFVLGWAHNLSEQQHRHAPAQIDN